MKTDTYQIVTDRIIAKLQSGTIPWKHFASSPLAQPRNLVSKKVYRGVNFFLLSGSRFGSEFWLTFNQAVNLGGSVKKGEHGEPITFWKFMKYIDKESGEEKEFPFLRHYTVFNVEQCEGIDYQQLEALRERESEANQTAEEIVSGMPNPPRLVIDGTPKAFYSPQADMVHMTNRPACVSDSAYYDTLFHELTHSTGHASRLDRHTLDGCDHHFGSKTYAAEELVAEMGAAMLCCESGIFQETEDNSASYIANWLSRLNDDPKLVVHAAGKAQKACDWILNRSADRSAITPLPASENVPAAEPQPAITLLAA
jgi:antirestriction protein ArdC